MWHTRLTHTYGIERPFVGAGMGFLSMPPLVAAVSNAGGLGILGAAPLPPSALVELIAATQALTQRPFGVDLIVENTAFGPSTTEGHIEACIGAKVPVVLFFWHPPPADWRAALREGGVRVWMTVSSLAAAMEAAEEGFDGIVVQGSDAGGHNRSRASLMTLIPAIRDALPDALLIAAGGIADARGVAAAMLLGADGVCVGTRLIVATESPAHEEYKRRVVEASVDDVALTRQFGPEWPDQPMKVIVNDAVRAGSAGAGAPIGHTQLGGETYVMPVDSAVLPTVDASGDFARMCIAAGESAGLVRSAAPAGAIVDEMMDGALRLIQRGAPSRSAH